MTKRMQQTSITQMIQTLSADPFNGRVLSECDGPNKSKLFFWIVGEATVVICQVYAEGGWHHYIGGKENRTDRTQREIALAAGLIFDDLESLVKQRKPGLLPDERKALIAKCEAASVTLLPNGDWRGVSDFELLQLAQKMGVQSTNIAMRSPLDVKP